MCRLLSTIAVLLSISGLVARNVNAADTTSPTTDSDVTTETTTLLTTTKSDSNTTTPPATVVLSTTELDSDKTTTKTTNTTTTATTTTAATTIVVSTAEPVNPCLPSPCPEYSTCEVTDDKYTCPCNEGYLEVDGKCVTSDPCSSSPCPEFSTCNYVADDKFTCECYEGYQEVGDECVKVCAEYVDTVNNTVVYYDVEEYACGNISSYPASNETVVVHFNTALVGTTVVANVTCKTACVHGETSKPIGVVRCKTGGEFSAPTWIDCSQTDPLLEEQLTSAVIDTSDPESVSSTTVTESVQVLEEVSNQDNITTQSADDFLTVTNNLLRASGDGATDAVQENSENIKNSVEQVAEIVDLEPVDSTYSSYENQQSNIAMAVVQLQPNASSVTRASEDTYFYGSNGTVHSNLAATELVLTTLKPTGSYISAIANAESRTSFVIYSNVNDLFPNSDKLDILSNDIVYGVSNGDRQVTMRFPITENINITSDYNRFDSESKKLDCVRWASGKWVSGSTCTSYRASDFYASCTCSEEGEYAIRAITVEVIVDDEGLSPGAIAGIVILSVVGVALIGGLAYYCYKKKQKVSDVDEAT